MARPSGFRQTPGTIQKCRAATLRRFAADPTLLQRMQAGYAAMNPAKLRAMAAKRRVKFTEEMDETLIRMRSKELSWRNIGQRLQVAPGTAKKRHDELSALAAGNNGTGPAAGAHTAGAPSYGP